jgi:hypothetical protein
MKLALVVLLASAVAWPLPVLAHGWYLLSPPIVKKSGGRAQTDSSRPLKEWDQKSAFDSADACEDFRAYAFSRVKRDLSDAANDAKAPQEEKTWAERLSILRKWQQTSVEAGIWGESQCISSDDPRLR